jgi:hypothetical protein
MSVLKEVLSISGKSGLYKLISQGKNMFIAESLLDHKRIPVYMRDKVVSLGDIAIYTENEEIPLAEVFKKIKEKEENQPIVSSSSLSNDELRVYFATVLPDFDREKVYPSDIKKILSWYNLLRDSEWKDFEREEKGEQEPATEEQKIAIEEPETSTEE